MAKRQVSPKALKALIKHNAIKQIKKLNLDQKEYQNLLELIEKHINTATYEELKKKGIVHEIIGGMKRERDEYPDKPIKRGLLHRMYNSVFGSPSTDNINTVHVRKEELKQKLDDEKELVKKYKIAQIRTLDAKRNESLVLSQLQSKKIEIMTEYQRMKSFLQINNDLIKDIPKEQEKLYTKYKSMDKEPERQYYDSWKKERDLIFDEMQINDRLYFDLTGTHLAYHNELSSNLSESSSSNDQHSLQTYHAETTQQPLLTREQPVQTREPLLAITEPPPPPPPIQPPKPKPKALAKRPAQHPALQPTEELTEPVQLYLPLPNLLPPSKQKSKKQSHKQSKQPDELKEEKPAEKSLIDLATELNKYFHK